MKGLTLFLLTPVLVVLAGCGGNDAKNDADPAQYDSSELGYDPQSRWTETGLYSYDFSHSENGNKCTTGKKEFSKKSAYCMGLQDTKLNGNCALPIRQSVYKSDCGEDFQEINIPAGFEIHGFDSRLQLHCQTADPGVQYFSYRSQFCNFLKNENLHKNCHWDARLEKFKQLKCQGAFSSEPPPAQDT